MIRCAWPAEIVAAAAAALGSRTIAGTAVPWDVPGRVSSGELVVFEPGSLDATARPVALRDHDRTRPIGTVVDATDTGTELYATIRVSRTADGDEALVLAGDGSLPMLSVGAEPTDASYDADGVLHVYAAEWLELSLLTIGAYAGARVAAVTASRHPGGNMPPTTATDEPDVVEPDELEPDDTEPNEDIEPDLPAEQLVLEAAAPRPAVVPIAAGRRTARPGRSAANPYADLTIRQLAHQINAARGGGNAQAARFVAAALAAQGSIEAALTDVTLVGTNNVGAMHRPAYQAELVELIGWGTPLIDALRQGDLQRGDYPNVTFNKWTTAPTVGLQTAEKTQITSTPVKIDPASAAVNTWAGGNDISQQVLDLGSPSFIEDYIRAAAMDYAKKSDTYAVTTLMTAATAVTTAADDSFISIVAALVGALSPATTPPGGLFLAMSYDQGVGLIGVPRDEGPAFWDGNVGFGTFTPTTDVGGLTAFVDPNMPARSYLLGHRQGATWYDLPGTPFNLRAVNVGLLGLDVAVYGYGALGIQYPGAFAKTTVPPVTP